MAHAYKTLGRSKPAAAIDTDLYVPAASSWVIISLITACNQSATPTTIRVAVKNASGAPGADDYLIYDMPIGAFEPLEFGKGIALLGGTDRISVYNTLATVSFLCFGDEVT